MAGTDTGFPGLLAPLGASGPLAASLRPSLGLARWKRAQSLSPGAGSPVPWQMEREAQTEAERLQGPEGTSDAGAPPWIPRGALERGLIMASSQAPSDTGALGGPETGVQSAGEPLRAGRGGPGARASARPAGSPCLWAVIFGASG